MRALPCSVLVPSLLAVALRQPALPRVCLPPPVVPQTAGNPAYLASLADKVRQAETRVLFTLNFACAIRYCCQRKPRAGLGAGSAGFWLCALPGGAVRSRLYSLSGWGWG